MAESIYTNIEIGGTIKRSDLKEFIQSIDDDLTDMGDDIDIDNITSFLDKNKVLCVNGFANWGKCDNILNFCKDHKLSIVYYNEAKDEYEADMSYWLPHMDEEITIQTGNDHSPVLGVDEIKPYVDFLLDIVDKGKEALPLYINDDLFEEFAKKGMENPTHLKNVFKEIIKERTVLYEESPELPPFIIEG